VICSIYGIEFLKDNVEACRKRLLSYFIGEQIDAESYPLFICLVLAMILVVIDGVYKQHAKGSL
jgi:chloramphenicol-sensitive protein RarD